MRHVTPLLPLAPTHPTVSPTHTQGAIRVLPGATHPRADGLPAAAALLRRKQAAFVRAALAIRLRAEAGMLAEQQPEVGPQAFLIEEALQGLLSKPKDALGAILLRVPGVFLSPQPAFGVCNVASAGLCCPSPATDTRPFPRIRI